MTETAIDRDYLCVSMGKAIGSLEQYGMRSGRMDCRPKSFDVSPDVYHRIAQDPRFDFIRDRVVHAMNPDVVGRVMGIPVVINPFLDRESMVLTANDSTQGVPVVMPVPLSFKRERLRSNLVIHVKSRVQDNFRFHKNETVALETLREMISEFDFRRYLTYKFILVRGASGLVYQTFRDQAHTRVWSRGALIEEICVHLDDHKIPMTDKVIAFKVIIESNEEEFRKLGNVYNMLKIAA